MNDFRLTVHQYRKKRIKVEKQMFGFADMEAIEQSVKRYAEAKAKYKAGIIDENFNPFTDDPNCKNCRKKRKR